MDFPKNVPGVGLVNGQFIDEDPLAATPGSLIPSAWGNSVTNEVLNAIKAGGLDPDEDDTTQLAKAIKALVSEGSVTFASQEDAEAGTDTTKAMSAKRVFQAITKVVTQATESALGLLKIATLSQANTGTDDSTAMTPKKVAAVLQTQTLNAGATAGTATAYTLSGIPGLSSYVSKLRLNITFHIASGANPTINVNALGEKNLKQYNNMGVKVGAAVPAGFISDVIYDGTDMVVLDSLPVDLLNTLATNVASAATVDLTSSAPNTRHINITGTTAIGAFTVTSGKCYFVRFNAALTLTNSASLVTQSGADIVTAAGDTCIIRATAANIVEVLCYTPGIPKSIGYRQSWQDLAASRSLNTNYTNSTGQPIKVAVNSSLPGTGNIRILIDGILVQFVSNPSNTSGTSCISELVPPGSTYQVQSSAAIAGWKELR